MYAALEARDYCAMQELAFSRRGFCSAELRRAVWLFLLGLSPEQALDARWRRELAHIERSGYEARVMHADVERSVCSWDVHTGIRRTVRDKKRVHLSEVMHAILQRHGGKLAYFQGFHDIALVFLEVGSPTQAFHMVERLALFFLSDQLCWPFDKGVVPLLAVLFGLLELLDAPVAQALFEADCGELHFALPWVLTWFAHSLPRLHQQVMRLFDCLLASHPATILYFVVALLLHHKDTIMRTNRDLPDMVSVLQSLPLHALDVEDWAASTWQLLQRVPPGDLLQRLPAPRRRALPLTSPLLHFPHPWMSRVPADATAESVEMSKLSPIYGQWRLGHPCSACMAGPRTLLWGLPVSAWARLRSLLRREGASAWSSALVRALGAAGVVAAVMRFTRPMQHSRPSSKA